MKHQKRDGFTHPDKLLDLWLRDSTDSLQTPSRPRIPRGLAVGLTVAGGIGAVVLLKYAIDVLVIAVAVLAVGLLLHGLGLRLAESEILSPASLLFIVLILGGVGYLLVVRDDPLDSLGKHMPAWVVDTLEWSEKHGWGRTVLIGPLRNEATASEVASTASAPAPLGDSLPSAPGLPRLAVTASSTSLRSGHHVTLMARAATSEGRPVDGRARFYDGETQLATVSFESQGGTGIASLVVGGLAVGHHEIRARFVGPLARTGPLSEPLIVTVREK